MTVKQQRSLIIISSSTVLGFLADTTIYSLAESKGGPFRIHVPKGWELFKLIAIGAITGLVVDQITNFIIESQKTEQEKELDKLADRDINAILEGKLRVAKPISINWV